jgi:hypothetical protein
VFGLVWFGVVLFGFFHLRLFGKNVQTSWRSLFYMVLNFYIFILFFLTWDALVGMLKGNLLDGFELFIYLFIKNSHLVSFGNSAFFSFFQRKFLFVTIVVIICR